MRAAYEAKVPLSITEQAFWEEFLRQNFKYKTEIFGGNNPLFMPFTTDEKTYEDTYIHNPKNLLLNPHVSQETVQKKAQIDVNYLDNTDRMLPAMGYGTYAKATEVDALNAVIEQIDNDMNKQQKKD